MISEYPDRLQQLASRGGPDQPGAGWQGASKTETVGYIYDIIRE